MSIYDGPGTGDGAENKRKSYSHGAYICCSWHHQLDLQSLQKLCTAGIIPLGRAQVEGGLSGANQILQELKQRVWSCQELWVRLLKARRSSFLKGGLLAKANG